MLYYVRGSQMIPISKYILNRKQKRATQLVARFCVYGVLGFYVFFTPFFISYLRHICNKTKK